MSGAGLPAVLIFVSATAIFIIWIDNNFHLVDKMLDEGREWQRVLWQHEALARPVNNECQSSSGRRGFK